MSWSPETFEPRLPMYDVNAVPERPWWDAVEESWGSGPNGLAVAIHRPARWLRCDGGRVLQREGLEALGAYDTEHPLPAPAPMTGQVWGWVDGERMVTSVHAGFVSGLVVVWGGNAAEWGDSMATRWPPPGAVLVAGPTPWGRDVPWAPVTTEIKR